MNEQRQLKQEARVWQRLKSEDKNLLLCMIMYGDIPVGYIEP